MVAVLAVTLLSAGVAPEAAAAGGVDGPEIVDTDRDTTPNGVLSTTTFGLERPAGATRSRQLQRPGWTVELAVPAGTQQVALTWTGDPIAHFEVRASGDGAWTPAVSLAGETAEGPDGSVGRPGAGPLWLGAEGVGRVRVELVHGLVSDVQLDAMTFTARRAAASGTRAVAGVASPAMPAGGPPIRLRSTWAPGGWGPDNATCGPVPKVNADLRHGIVHHTVGANTYASADVPAILAGIYRFHTDGRGWCDIAYNVLIDRFGRVWEGRSGGLDHAVRGGHTQGFNAESTGISLLGQFQPGAAPAAAQPSTAMVSSLRDVLAWKLGSQGLDPRGRIRVTSQGNPRVPAGTVIEVPIVNGHRDTAHSSCPGDYLYARLPRLRIDVAARIAATNDPVRWRPHVTGARYWTQMLLDAEGTISRPSRIGSYTSQVTRAGRPQGELTALAILSPAVDARVGFVDRLYRAGFGRAPDTAGLLMNVRHRDRAMPNAELAGNFLRSSEYRARYGTPDDPTFITLLFRNALGRDPSVASLAYWQRLIDSGLSRPEVLLRFSEHVEHRARTATATTVTTAFFVMVRRVPSGASLAYWTPRLESGTPTRDLAVGLLRSAEYLRRF